MNCLLFGTEKYHKSSYPHMLFFIFCSTFSTAFAFGQQTPLDSECFMINVSGMNEYNVITAYQRGGCYFSAKVKEDPDSNLTTNKSRNFSWMTFSSIRPRFVCQGPSLCLKVASVYNVSKLWIVEDYSLHKHRTRHNCFYRLPAHSEGVLLLLLLAGRGRPRKCIVNAQNISFLLRLKK